MITVFTLCSANYLAHAKTLGDSLVEHNPGYRFLIGLVDHLPQGVEPSFWHPYELIPVADLNIPSFLEMSRKYDIVELNTAVKPFYIDYLYQHDSNVDQVIYLDPDILVCGSFRSVAQNLRTHNIIVTPHSCTFDDSPTNMFYEISMLMTGIYNLGFIATARSETTFAFLRWWQRRVEDYCYSRVGTGLFVDQIWLTLAPLYFPDIYVEKDPGFNVCYWNHFERRLGWQDGRYVVNGKFDLIFHHFSSYDPMRPEAITTRTGVVRSSFIERPDLKPIYDDYGRRLLNAGYGSIRSCDCAFGRKPPTRVELMRRATIQFLEDFLGTLPISIKRPLKFAMRCAHRWRTRKQVDLSCEDGIRHLK